MSTTNANPTTLAQLLREGSFFLEAGSPALAPEGSDVALACRYLSEAYRDIQLRTKLWWPELIAATTVGKRAFSAPGDILGRVVREGDEWQGIAIKTDGAGALALPEKLEWDAFRARYGTLDGVRSGGPVHWAWDERGGNQILVEGPCEYADAHGFRMEYLGDPGELRTVVHSGEAGLTATVEADSTTVTLSGESEDVRVGQAFGVKASELVLPSTWYRIEEVDGDELTLSRGYERASGSGKLFTISDVSPLEWMFSGLIGSMPPIHLAKSRFLEADGDFEGAELNARLFAGEVGRIKERSLLGAKPRVEARRPSSAAGTWRWGG